MRSNHTPTPIDLSTETLVGLPDAARRLPPFRNGRPVNPSTVWRWVRAGVVLPEGRRVRLAAVRLGGRWVTSVEALARFAEAQTPSPPSDDLPNPLPRTRSRRQAASVRAEDQLIRRGA